VGSFLIQNLITFGIFGFLKYNYLGKSELNVFESAALRVENFSAKNCRRTDCQRLRLRLRLRLRMIPIIKSQPNNVAGSRNVEEQKKYDKRKFENLEIWKFGLPFQT
jgi:hypothetical protein